ncbi:MAG: hypothetical protein IIW47_00145 [Bacteroidales bacterium]|jgi:hypothetical protein|nr:hypothetical protein [Bacteroidales bacterium]
MSNIKKIEKFLKDALALVTDKDGAFDAALLDKLSDDEYDFEQVEAQLLEIELSLAEQYPETPYYTYLMTLINKIKEIYGIDEENINEDYLLPDEDFVLEFPSQELTDEDAEFEKEGDSALEYLFE